jgi:hypothetical protein
VNGEQGEFDFDRLPSAPVDQRTAATLALLRIDPVNDHDRARIVAAIISDAITHSGTVDMNRVRARLVDRHGKLDVRPTLVGATVNGLAGKGVLEPAGWTVNSDTSGNRGKPLRLWKIAGERWCAA